MHEIAERVLTGDPRAIARALRWIDDRVPQAEEILRDLFPSTGKAWVIGVTGNPGAGKSTLCDRLIEAFRKRALKVAVIAVDPTSPYTGGAILGDRIRMSRHATDPGVFIRSVATRGHLGGLSRSARDMVRILDAAGYDIVIVETVGVGQDELEITRTAHSTLVVMAPGLGDEVQAIKAGIMETADVFAVNKADKDGADATVRDIELMIALGGESLVAVGKIRGHVVHGGAGEAAAHGVVAPVGASHWTPPISRVVSTRGVGFDELVAALESHRTWLTETTAGQERRRARLAEELRETLREALIEAAEHDLAATMDLVVASVAAREVDPYTATRELVEKFRARF
jgi:LAO/AO transport system kinase